MTIDVSLIPQNRVENLISKLSEIENNIGNIGTDITNNLVHKSGNETISGEKTFTNPISITTTADEARFITTFTDVSLDTNPTTNVYNGFKSVDSNGVEFANCNCSYNTAGRIGSNFYVNRNDSGTSVSGTMGIYIDKNGTSAYTQAPTPASGDNSTKIATTNWCYDPAKSTNLVHRNGNETIIGTKTYNIDGYDMYKSTSMDITNKPSESHSLGTNYADKNGNIHGQIFLRTESDGSVIQAISCLNHSQTSWAQFAVGFDSSDIMFARLNGNNIKGFVTETWKSGTSWYRIWSDGWIEQGGQTPKTSDALISISFARAFSQDNPNVQLTRRFYYDNDATGCQNRTTGVSSVTTTGFKCYDNGWSSAGGSVGVWYACGY